jgi:hypothetical protein
VPRLPPGPRHEHRVRPRARSPPMRLTAVPGRRSTLSTPQAMPPSGAPSWCTPNQCTCPASTFPATPPAPRLAAERPAWVSAYITFIGTGGVEWAVPKALEQRARKVLWKACKWRTGLGGSIAALGHGGLGIRADNKSPHWGTRSFAYALTTCVNGSGRCQPRPTHGGKAKGRDRASRDGKKLARGARTQPRQRVRGVWVGRRRRFCVAAQTYCIATTCTTRTTSSTHNTSRRTPSSNSDST